MAYFCGGGLGQGRTPCSATIRTSHPYKVRPALRVSPAAAMSAGSASAFTHGWETYASTALSPLNVVLVLMLVAVVPQQAFGPPPMQDGQAPRLPLRARQPRQRQSPYRFRSTSSRCRTDSRSRCGRRRRCCTTRPTSTSIATAASGWPKVFATARTTPASPKAIASSCCRTPTATARPTARTPSCRSRR